MKNFFITIFFTFLVILIGSVLFLTVNGFETKKFNNYVSKKIEQNIPDLKLNIKKIQIKLDLKNINLFFSSSDPEIQFEKIDIPVSEVKIYVNFLSLFKMEPKIKKISVESAILNIVDVQKLAIKIKPSNFKSFILNNIFNGKLITSFDLVFTDDFKLKSYKFKGRVKQVDIIPIKDISVKNTSFNFIADEELILINAIKARFNGLPINNGKIKINKKNEINIDGELNIKTTRKLNINEDLYKIFKKDFLKNKITFTGELSNVFNLSFDNTFKLTDFKYNVSGLINNLSINLINKYKKNFLDNNIDKILINKTKIEFNFNKNQQNRILIDGLYKVNHDDKYVKFKIEDKINGKRSLINLNLDLNQKISFETINYFKKKNITANIVSEFTVFKNKIDIKRITYKERENKINIENLRIANSAIKSIEKIEIKTYKNKIKNNDLQIKIKDNILINGKKYDASNIIKLFDTKNKKQSEFLQNLSKKIEINISEISTKNLFLLSNFKLLGVLEKGEIIKLSSKSEFSDDKYLDISLKIDKKTNKKILEIFSDLPKPLLIDYAFFQGIEGGKLLFSKKFDDNDSSTQIIIENFQVKKAPKFAKLLTLADFRGMVDLLSGEGVSFDVLEINLSENKKVLKIEEIIAIGPSISILMEGYRENDTGLTSLSGTMVPAKTFNKLISKIPLLGDILIPKEVGEGLFGISFKIKGFPNKMKTTVNPIKTITPRFITKILERKKN